MPYTFGWHYYFLEAKREDAISETIECKGFGSPGWPSLLVAFRVLIIFDSLSDVGKRG